MDWNIVALIIVSVVMSIVSIVFYRRARKRAVTPEQKLRSDRVMFFTFIICCVPGMWWLLTR